MIRDASRLLRVFLVVLVCLLGVAPTQSMAQDTETASVVIGEERYDNWGELPPARQSEILQENGCTFQPQQYTTVAGLEYCNEDVQQFNADGQLVGENERFSYAYQIYSYATGRLGNNTCISCDFMSFFMVGLNDFSHSVYLVLQGIFATFAPIGIAMWIGFRVAKLMATGGEDGKSFIYEIAGRLALFAIVWLLVLGGSTDRPTLWNLTGPQYLEFAFGLSGEIRDEALSGDESDTGRITSGEGTPFNCGGVGTITDQDFSEGFIQAGMEVSCITERTHIIGLASGLGMLFTTWSGASTDSGFLPGPEDVARALTKLAAGFTMIAAYGFSAIWLTFLVLDVVVRGLVTAAFAPAIAAMFIFAATRGFAVNAIKALGGALITAISLSIISIIALFLMTNVVDVFNAVQSETNYENRTVEAIPRSNAIEEFGIFIQRIQESNPDEPVVPMDLSTPWFYYMLFSAFAIFALGKKIIAMLENMIGQQGASVFADKALGAAKSSVKMGLGATGVSLLGANIAASGGKSLLKGGGDASDTIKDANPLRGQQGPGGALQTAQAMRGVGSEVSGTVDRMADGGDGGN